MQVIEAIYHRKLEEIGPDSVALLEELQYAALTHVHQIRETGSMWCNDVSGTAEQRSAQQG
jgi:hypothetical protein